MGVDGHLSGPSRWCGWWRGATSGRARRARRGDAALVNRRGLLADLALVIGAIQCTRLILDGPTLGAVLQAFVVMAMMWWAWIASVWLGGGAASDPIHVRLLRLATSIAMLVAAAISHEAFGSRATLFAMAYGVARLCQFGLAAATDHASDDAPPASPNPVSYSAVAVALLCIAASTAGTLRLALWGGAFFLEWRSTLEFIVRRWEALPVHVAPRHARALLLGLLIVGNSADYSELSTGRLIMVGLLRLALAAALSFAYSGHLDPQEYEHPPASIPPAQHFVAARDIFSYLHFPIFAGTVLIGEALRTDGFFRLGPARHDTVAALIAGVLTFLVGLGAVQARSGLRPRRELLVAVCVLVGLLLLHVRSPLTVLAVVVLTMWAMIGAGFVGSTKCRPATEPTAT